MSLGECVVVLERDINTDLWRVAYEGIAIGFSGGETVNTSAAWVKVRRNWRMFGHWLPISGPFLRVQVAVKL